MTTLPAPLLGDPAMSEPAGPIEIRVLGEFELLKAGQSLPLRPGGKPEALLFNLAIRHDRRASRDVLVSAIWPDVDSAHAAQSLNTLLYSLHKLLGGALLGLALVVQENGCYRLNPAAGIDVDVARFDRLMLAGDECDRQGNPAGAALLYGQATGLYRGDLCTGSDTAAAIERERLCARYMTLLAYLADHHYRAGEHSACLDCTRRMLDKDPCREDAHRLAMRCYVRLGQRAQAFRQYRLCQHILRAEFDAVPEAATMVLYDRIRSDPDRACDDLIPN